MKSNLYDKLMEKIEQQPEGCHVWNGYRDRKGYGIITFKKKSRKIHRLMWEHFNGEIPPDLIICHTCDNPPCVNPDHLFLGTHAINALDGCLKGRKAIKLNERAVLDILRAVASRKETYQVISRRFGISPATISDILYGRRWKHLTLRETYVARSQ